MLGTLSTKDVVVIAAYLVLVFAVGFYFSRHRRTSSDYFLAGRNVGWFAIGASLFSTGMSAEYFLILPWFGFRSGLAVANVVLQASLIILLLGWILTPLYLRSGVFTMPEFLERRYNGAARWYLSIVSISAYVLTKISVTIFAGAVLLHAVVGWDMITSAFVIVVATGLYTIIGGLGAVIYTNLIQTGILILGPLALTVIGMKRAGGWHDVVANTPPEFWHMFRAASDPDFPWTGVVFGAPIVGFWYWCTDQYIVQRVLSAKNLDNARGGAIFASFLRTLPVFILILPGIIALKLSDGNISADKAYGWMALTFLPSGVRGLMVAGIIAALMSSLSGVLHSTSTLLTLDIFKRLRLNTDEKTLVNFGRLATAAVVSLGVLWIFFIGSLDGQGVFELFLKAPAYIAPPIAACFLFGIFWNRVNGTGAITSLFTGLVLGGFRFAIEIQAMTKPLSNAFLLYVDSINFLHFVIFLFVACSGVLVGVSLATKSPDINTLKHLTFTEAGAAYSEKGKYHWINVSASGALVIILIGLWWAFR